MLPLEHVLAVAVLITPPAGPEAEALPEHACLLRTVRDVAVRLEVLDPREQGYFLAHPRHFAGDLALLRKRYRDLADAPPLGAAAHLPTADVAAERLAYNREHHRQLRLRRDGLGPRAAALDEALAEADRLYHLWDLLRDGRSECYYVTVRRQALLSLRRALGEGAFFRGAMPPSVPVWGHAAPP
jgi:hypothetical protein